jgi:hypothetical protein
MEFPIGNQSSLLSNDDDTKDTNQPILDAPTNQKEDSPSSPLWWKKVAWSTNTSSPSTSTSLRNDIHNQDTSSSSLHKDDHDLEHAASYKYMDEDTTQISSTSQQYADVVQDCSFFFHDTKDKVLLATNTTMSNSWSLNATATESTPTSNTTSHSSIISLSSVIPPRYRAAFRARYQQLNLSSVEAYPTNDDNHDDHELWLQEESLMSNTPVTNYPRRQETTTTTLPDNNNIPYVSWYERPKIHIPLPKDRVRLLLDDEMEPGILSIERQQGSSSSSSSSTRLPSQYHHHHPSSSSSFMETTTTMETDPMTTPPHPHDELVYVLTVDSDLYQRIVGEISDALSSRWGWYRIEEGRVDITLAIMALGFVFFFMLLATILLQPVK